MNYDALIISEEFNDDVVELIFALLRGDLMNTYLTFHIFNFLFLIFKFIFKAYIIDLKIYPFSLTIFYPSLDKEDRYGRTPVYVKAIPRGDISQIRSDYSAIELMMVIKMIFN